MVNKKHIKDIPGKTGIYIFWEGNTPIYIGKAVNLKARLYSHLQNSKLDKKESLIIQNADKITYEILDHEFKALVYEAKLIQRNRPKYNIIWKDDRSYLYIKITKEDYPHIHIVRAEHDKKAIYFGPFSSYKTVQNILRTIRKIIPYCQQNRIEKSPCFYSKIKLCSPCPSSIEKLEGYDKQIQAKIYRKNISKIKALLSGKTDVIQKDLKKELDALILTQKYEEAIFVRNKLKTFERLMFLNDDEYHNDNKKFIDNCHLEYNFLMEKHFGIKPKNTRIECYDISNTSGREAAASMVVSDEFSPHTSEYRKFKIKTVKKMNDFAMLRETIGRRFKNDWTKPSLIIIDGGRPQLRAISILGSQFPTPAIGLAKNPDRLFHGATLMPINKREIPNLFRIFVQLRDESHRFAKKYHVALRNNIK